MNKTPQSPNGVEENIAFLYNHFFKNLPRSAEEMRQTKYEFIIDKRAPELQSDGTIVIRDNQTGQGFDPSTGKKVSN